MRFYFIVLMLVLSLALGGCFTSDSDSGSDPISQGLTYYYAEFPDVAIPNEMQPEKNDTFISYTADGVKLGTQYFKGRVEIASLVRAMQGHLQRDSWTLRSVFRARGAILIFEQPNRMCSIYIHEDIINTGMLVFVSPKLATGALQYSVPTSTSTEPLGTSDPYNGSSSSGAPASATTGATTNNGNITVYPAK